MFRWKESVYGVPVKMDFNQEMGVMTHLSSGVRPNCISGFPRGGRSSEQPQAANQQDEPAQTAAASNESETEQQATAKDSDS